MTYKSGGLLKYEQRLESPDKKSQKTKKMPPQYEETTSNDEALHSSLAENLTKVKNSLGNSGDLVVRDFKMGSPFYVK
ncbi:hypothetical protein F6Y05_33320 [Bacillus megaterium]|nr:hypothetical protein [Priestia megaterium]